MLVGAEQSWPAEPRRSAYVHDVAGAEITGPRRRCGPPADRRRRCRSATPSTVRWPLSSTRTWRPSVAQRSTVGRGQPRRRPGSPPSAGQQLERGEHRGDHARYAAGHRPTGRGAASASEVAVGTGSSARSAGDVDAIPTTQAGPVGVSTRSARMPHSLRSPTSTSLGHFSTAGSAAARRTAVGDREPGQQRQPGPARRVDTVGPDQHRHGDARSRRRGPGPTLPAAPGRLVVGDQHRARPARRRGPRPPGRRWSSRSRPPDRSAATSPPAGSAPGAAQVDRSHRIGIGGP